MFSLFAGLPEFPFLLFLEDLSGIFLMLLVLSSKAKVGLVCFIGAPIIIHEIVSDTFLEHELSNNR